ncbi:MAG: PepSY-associated TM helix domain-containing protein [Bacteroidales bacterium]|nr:PepSY-associated TM helix domain-containing protein [Bacteroidales bacterium]
MKIKWRKWNRAIHRDLGYIFFATTIIYAISGIAVNHIKEWNPNYNITVREVQLNLPEQKESIKKDMIIEALKTIGEDENYKKHYFPDPSVLKIFLDGGNIQVDLTNGAGYLEKISRRPILHAVNFLHYNPGKWWTLFSDIFAGALILLAITGLFILRGKNGIKRRGAILTALGIIIPLLYLILFY